MMMSMNRPMNPSGVMKTFVAFWMAAAIGSPPSAPSLVRRNAFSLSPKTQIRAVITV